MKNKFQVPLSYESIFNISRVCFQGKDKVGFFSGTVFSNHGKYTFHDYFKNFKIFPQSFRLFGRTMYLWPKISARWPTLTPNPKT